MPRPIRRSPLGYALFAVLLIALAPAREAAAQRATPIAAPRTASLPVAARAPGDCALAVCPVPHERLGWQITGAVIGVAVGLFLGAPQQHDSAGHAAAVGLLAASLGGAGGFYLGGALWDSHHRTVITH